MSITRTFCFCGAISALMFMFIGIFGTEALAQSQHPTDPYATSIVTLHDSCTISLTNSDVEADYYLTLWSMSDSSIDITVDVSRMTFDLGDCLISLPSLHTIMGSVSPDAVEAALAYGVPSCADSCTEHVTVWAQECALRIRIGCLVTFTVSNNNSWSNRDYEIEFDSDGSTTVSLSTSSYSSCNLLLAEPTNLNPSN